MAQIQVYTVSAYKATSRNDFNNVLLARIGLLKEALSGKQDYFYWALHNFCFGIYDHERRRIVEAGLPHWPMSYRVQHQLPSYQGGFKIHGGIRFRSLPHEYQLPIFSLIAPGALQAAEAIPPISGPSPLTYGPHSGKFTVLDAHNADHIIDPASPSSSHASKDNGSWNLKDVNFEDIFANMNDQPGRQNAAPVTVYDIIAAEQNVNEVSVAPTAKANPADAASEKPTLLVKLRLSPSELANFVIRIHKRADVERAKPIGSDTVQIELQRTRDLTRPWLQCVGAGLAYGPEGLQEVSRLSQRSKQSQES